MVQLSIAARNARADSVSASVGAAGILRILTGPKPMTCDDAEMGTPLVNHITGSPFAPPAANTELHPTLPPNVTAIASGTAGYWRQYKANGTTCVAQGSVGLADADMILNTLDLVADEAVQVNGWAFFEGGG